MFLILCSCGHALTVGRRECQVDVLREASPVPWYEAFWALDTNEASRQKGQLHKALLGAIPSYIYIMIYIYIYYRALERAI